MPPPRPFRAIPLTTPRAPAIRTLPELHLELRAARTEDTRYTTAILASFVGPLLRKAGGKAWAERSLDYMERQFPEHSAAFISVRAEHGLCPSYVFTAPGEDIDAIPVQRAAGSEEAGGDLPPYAKEDPDPLATMQLHRQLAEEEEYFGGAELAYVISVPAPRYELERVVSPGEGAGEGGTQQEAAGRVSQTGRWRALLVRRRFSL